MSPISAMPSVSSGNGNKMFILRGRQDTNPRAAYDAKGGLKGDDDPFAGMEKNNPKQIAAWAKDNMSIDDIGELVALLTDGNSASDARPDPLLSHRPVSGLGASPPSKVLSTATAEKEMAGIFGGPRPRRF